MSGRRLRGFRQGDLAEGMGLEILRRLAFVAPVPRAEDVGIDAVCTLQRRDGELLYPEDTFAVQIKSWTTRSLSLEEPDMAWLDGLDLPLSLTVSST